jgi:hypothetical protein
MRHRKPSTRFRCGPPGLLLPDPRGHICTPLIGSTGPPGCRNTVCRCRPRSGRSQIAFIRGAWTAPAAWRAGTAARSGLTGAAPGRCPGHAGSPAAWTMQRRGRVWSARRGSGGIPATDSPSPAGRLGGRCPGPSAAGRACAGCSCRLSCAQRAVPGQQSRRRYGEDLGPAAAGGRARPARRTILDWPARIAPS